MLRKFLFFALCLPLFAGAQNLGRCGACLWANAGTQKIIEQYVMEDSAIHRLNLHAVRISVSKDTLSAGISMRNPNDPNCRECQLVRFDSKGHAYYVFDNSQINEGKVFKTQYGYDEQLRVKHILYFVRDLSSEYDTAYHMTSFELIDYYNGFSTTRAFSGSASAFSTNPRQAPLYVRTETYDAKGRPLMRKTKVTAQPAMNDSSVFTYYGVDSVGMKFYQGKNLIYEYMKIFELGKIVSMHETFYVEDQVASDQYSYDSEGRIRFVKSSGDTGAANCGSGIGSTAEIRYGKDGLPLMIIFRGAGDYCALMFHYVY